jgi:predicted RNase H-like HicB family nuclease
MAEAARQYQTGLTYTAMLTPGEDCWICGQMAEVPEAISQGRTEAEARANVRRSS